MGAFIGADHGSRSGNLHKKKGFNMLYEILYFDASISEVELQFYEVEANDAYQAEEYFKQYIQDMTGITIYAIGKKDAPHEEYDAHSCSAEADEFGFCTVCGAIVHGSQADYDLHGYDPPDTY